MESEPQSLFILYNFMKKSETKGLFGLLRSLGSSKKEELRILILGLDNAGKTTIVKSLCNEVLCL